MGDLTDPTEQSPGGGDDATVAGNGLQVAPENRGVKRARAGAANEDDDDDDDKPGRERRKIDIKFIQDKSRRHITFSKRKAGIMKKAYELSVLTGTQVLLLVVSETGLVYTFTTPKLQPLVTKAEGKNLIQACLNAAEPVPENPDGVNGAEEPGNTPEDLAHAQVQSQQQGMPRNMQPQYNLSAEQQQQIAYQQYMQAQQNASGYPLPPQI